MKAAAELTIARTVAGTEPASKKRPEAGIAASGRHFAVGSIPGDDQRQFTLRPHAFARYRELMQRVTLGQPRGLRDGGYFSCASRSAYTDLLGRAVYNFAYLEWAVIYTVDTLSPGYLAQYTGASRPIPSGQVAASFCQQVTASLDLSAELRSRLAACAFHFTKLVEDRNRLVHAHPYTAEGGAQQLSYRGRLPPALWPLPDLEATAREFDSAACEMNNAFRQLLGAH